MPNDQQIQDAEMKKVIQQLKQKQTLEKIANDESSPDTATIARDIIKGLRQSGREDATSQLIQSLRQPRESQVDLRPLFALASPNVGQRLLQATSAPSTMTPQEQRLAKASELEMLTKKLRSQAAESRIKREERVELKDRSTFEKAYDQAGGFGRGSKVQRDLKEQSNLLSDAVDMINDISVRGDALTPQVARDFSQLMSRSISGGSPAIQLVEATIMKNLSGSAKEMFQYLTGTPTENYLGEEAFEELKQQFGRLYKQKLTHFAENVARQRNKVRHINPEYLKQFDDEYGYLYDISPTGQAIYKEFGGYGSRNNVSFNERRDMEYKPSTEFSIEDIKAELLRRGLM